MSVAGAKLGAFAVSAALAGLSGALAAFRFQIVGFSGYDVFQSIYALAFTVLGGVGYVGGAVVAAIGAPSGLFSNFFYQTLNITTIDNWLPIVSGFLVIGNIVTYPDGIVTLLSRQKDAIAARLPARGRKTAGAAAADLAIPGQAAWRDTVPRVPAGQTVLIAREVSVRYGNVTAVDQVSLELIAGQVLGVIGPNGAGKTSLIDGLTGFTRLAGGTVQLCGADVTRLRPASRARAGLGRTFQNLELFDDLSVRENILTALDSHRRLAYARDLVYPHRSRLNAAAQAAISLLDLERDLDTIVADLPQGRRRMVAIARLVAQEPAAILLDEPAAGLNGPERRAACELFRALASDLGAAVLLVEHNIDVVSATCDQLIVLDFGKVIASGPTGEVLREPVVRDAYLGRISAQAGTPTTVAEASEALRGGTDG
jgi:sulfate-transporting ATPase